MGLGHSLISVFVPAYTVAVIESSLPVEGIFGISDDGEIRDDGAKPVLPLSVAGVTIVPELSELEEKDKSLSEGRAVLAWDAFEDVAGDTTLSDILAAKVDETPELLVGVEVTGGCSREARTSSRPDEPDELAVDGNVDAIGEPRSIVTPRVEFPMLVRQIPRLTLDTRSMLACGARRSMTSAFFHLLPLRCNLLSPAPCPTACPTCARTRTERRMRGSKTDRGDRRITPYLPCKRMQARRSPR